jgi:hypothetical protein
MLLSARDNSNSEELKAMGNDITVELSFDMRKIAYDGPDDTMGTINEMIECLTDDYCWDCTMKAVQVGDFSALASATKRPEKQELKIPTHLGSSPPNQ